LKARTRLRTALCDLLGIEVPVLLAGMGPVAGGMEPVATRALAAAVSNAGGLGVLGGVSYPPERLREEIRALRQLTDRPFGVDLLLPAALLGGGASSLRSAPLPPTAASAEVVAGLQRICADLGVTWQQAPAPPPAPRLPEGMGWADAQMEVVIEERVPVFASGLGSPGPWIERLHANGTVVLSLVGDVRSARRVAAVGVDAVVAQGTEAGGHTGRIGTLALVPQVQDAVAPVPVIAAGGIADGRALAAVLALGAVGAWCGTAFLVAAEANQPELQKQRILDAAAEDTVVTRLFSGKTMRNVTNPLIEAWEESGLRALPLGAQGAIVRDLVHSLRAAGREDLLMNAAGQTAGMLHAIRPASEILEEMVAQAAEIVGRRLPASVEV
jgi:NAD(P)H-dependent flavin oxidoreductase YrpB (nitropropane dioxygenase family)